MRGMHYRLVFCLLFGWALPLCAQPDTVWSVRVQSGSNVTLVAATELSGGDFAVAGTETDSNNVTHMIVARISASGQVLWARVLTSDWNEQATALVAADAGHLALIGYGGVEASAAAMVIYGVGLQGDSLWRSVVFGEGLTKVNDATLLADGNVAAAGYTLGADGLHSDLWLLKFTVDGEMLWTRRIGYSDSDVGARIKECADHTLLIGGHTRSMGAGDWDVWIVRTDSAGNTLSSETSGAASLDVCYGMAVGDSGAWLCGRSENSGQSEGLAVRVSTGGVPQWSGPFSVGGADDELRGVIMRPDGSGLAVGWNGASAESAQPWILTFTHGGTQTGSWLCPWFTSGRFYTVLPVRSGGQLAVGSVVEGYVGKGYVLRLAPPAGIRGVVRDVETQEPLSGVRVCVAGTGRCAVSDAAGRYSLELNAGTYDLVASGECVSTDTTRGVTVLPDTAIEVPISVGVPHLEVVQTSLNLVVQNHIPQSVRLMLRNTGSGAMDYAVACETVSPPLPWLSVQPVSGQVPAHDSTSVWVRVAADTTNDGVHDYTGCLHLRAHACPDSVRTVPVFVTVLDVPRRPRELPGAFELRPPYPNPFNPLTELVFSIPADGDVRLAVYDVTGRLTCVLAEGRFARGEHRVTFDGSQLAAGVYIARLETRGATDVQKMLLVK